MKTKTTVFVTGATGFIGKATVARLLEDGFQISALVRTPEKGDLLRDLGIKVVHGDLNARGALERGIDSANVVLHLASGLHRPWDEHLHQININGTQHIAQVCHDSGQSPHLIIVSSLAARGPQRPTGPPSPISHYGAAKLAAEEAACRAYDSDAISIVRPPMVFGPNDRATKPIFDAVHRGLIVASKDPSARFSMIDVRDLSYGLSLLCQSAAIGAQDPLYFGDSQSLRIEELSSLISEELGLKTRTLHSPRWLLWTVCSVLEIWARMTGGTTALNRDKYLEMTNGPWTCDARSAQRYLSWHPLADLQTRLIETYQSYYPSPRDT